MIQEWLSFLDRQGRSPATLRGYRSDLQHFTHWYQERYGDSEPDLARVIGRDIEDYKAAMQDGRAAPRTINRRLATLSGLFRWAHERGLLHENPTAETKLLTIPARRPKALNAQQKCRLDRAVREGKDPLDIAVLSVLLETGIRVGELLALRRGDIEIGERSGTLTVRRGKGGGGTRRVPLVLQTRKDLAAYFDSLGRELAGSDPLWWTRQGVLRSSSTVNRIVERYAKRAELRDITPHTLRHTFATLYLRTHPNCYRDLAALLGHARLETAMIYTEPNEDDLLNRMESVGRKD